MEGGELHCFVIQEVKWISLSSLYVEATEVSKMRFKARVRSDTAA